MFLLFFVVNYSSDVLPKHNYFGYKGGPDDSVQFHFVEPMPTFTPGSSKDHIEKLSEGSQETLRELATDAQLEGTSYLPLEKF